MRTFISLHFNYNFFKAGNRKEEVAAAVTTASVLGWRTAWNRDKGVVAAASFTTTNVLRRCKTRNRDEGAMAAATVTVAAADVVVGCLTIITGLAFINPQ